MVGFLDRINANKTTEVADKKPNPLGARKNPLAARKPSVPLKPKVEETQVETNQQNAAIEHNKQAVEAQQEHKATETVSATEIVDRTEEAVVAEQAPEEQVTEETAEAVAEEAKEEETVAVPAEEVKAEEAPPEEEAKSKPKTNNRRKNTKPAPKAETAEDAPTFYEMPTTQMDYAEAVEAIRSPFVDETWEAFKQEIINDLSSIPITEDMNIGTLKVVSAELSILRDKIFYPLYEAKANFERYSLKEPEGLIERIKRINSVGGNNDTERRRNGILACVNYDTPAGAINLYELMDEARARYSFLRAIDESIKFKKDLLITMNSSLKLEKDLI